MTRRLTSGSREGTGLLAGLAYGVVPLLLLALAGGCDRCAALKDAATAGGDTDALSEVETDERSRLAAKYTFGPEKTGLMFTYVDDAGVFRHTENKDEIPDIYRNDVLVVDLGLSPEERMSDTYAVVADLTRTNDQGVYPVRVEPRADFERAISLKRRYKLTMLDRTRVGAQEPAPDVSLPTPAPNTDSVILYSTSWCRYCQNMRKLLAAQQVPFIERDIEKDQSAAVELMAKARQAGLGNPGVPVVDFRGSLVVGYDPEGLANAVRKLGVPNAPPSRPAPGP